MKDWEILFRQMYNDNESGGSSRWLVSPDTVLLFFKSTLSLQKNELREERRKIKEWATDNLCSCDERKHDPENLMQNGGEKWLKERHLL